MKKGVNNNMKDSLIHSGNLAKRNPAAAFILSFIVTGLGQMYNAELSKGCVFLLLRILPLLLLPLYLVMEKRNNYTGIFIVFTAFYLIVWVISSIEAFVSALRSRRFIPQIYNTSLFYSLYIFIYLIVMFLSMIHVSLFFDININDENNMNPTFTMDEFLLINRYSINELTEGDAVLYTHQGRSRPGRIIAREGDLVKFNNGKFTINGITLPVGVLDNVELTRMGYDSHEDLFFEINNNYKYTILMSSSGKKSQKMSARRFTIQKNSFLLSADNRREEGIVEIVTHENITGRIEGIIFSNKIKRIFLLPYLKN